MAKFVLSAFADEAGNSLAEQIAGLKRNGINYIEPRSIDAKGILEFSDEEILAIKAELDKNGIKVGSLGSPIGKYDITGDFEPHYNKFIRALEICNLLDTKYMRMFSFFIKDGDYAKWRGEVIRRLTVMTKEAEKYGVTLCHENESHIYGQMPKEVNDLLTSVPALGGIFDAANYRMHDADVIEGIKATFNNFKYMHIKDAIFASQEVVPAGEGEGKIAEILNYIDENTDAEVFLTLEPHLFVFGVYKAIDTKELKGKHHFETSEQSFDFAANALKNLLTDLGFKECDGKWTR